MNTKEVKEKYFKKLSEKLNSNITKVALMRVRLADILDENLEGQLKNEAYYVRGLLYLYDDSIYHMAARYLREATDTVENPENGESPEDILYWVRLAQAMEMHGDAEADQYFRKAVTKSAMHDPYRCNYKGYAYMKLKPEHGITAQVSLGQETANLIEATKCFEKAIKLDSTNLCAEFFRALCNKFLAEEDRQQYRDWQKKETLQTDVHCIEKAFAAIAALGEFKLQKAASVQTQEGTSSSVPKQRGTSSTPYTFFN